MNRDKFPYIQEEIKQIDQNDQAPSQMGHEHDLDNDEGYLGDEEYDEGLYNF